MSPNALNQYLGRRTTDMGAGLFLGYDYDADGNLAAIRVQGDMDCDGDLDCDGDVDLFDRRPVARAEAEAALGVTAVAAWASGVLSPPRAWRGGPQPRRSAGGGCGRTLAQRVGATVDRT